MKGIDRRKPQACLVANKMNNELEKIKYRSWAKEMRQKLDLKAISVEIENKLRNLSEYKCAKTVMSYLAKDIEISLNNLFDDKSKSWFLPVIECHFTSADPLLALRMTPIVVVPYIYGKTRLKKGRFDILEPEIIDDNFFNQSEKKIKLDLIFVPGLCFDKERNRIGFGKGFYDQFLRLNPNSFKIGCCPKECLLDKLPIDEWDVKVDLVITN